LCSHPTPGGQHFNKLAFGPVVLQKNISKIFSYKSSCKNSFLYCGPTRTSRAMISTNLFRTMSEYFHINFSFCSPLVLEKILKTFSYTSTCKKFPPSDPPGAMILTNLLLYYIRMLPCKFQLLWPSSSLEEDF
jgi:hypothetical protein